MSVLSEKAEVHSFFDEATSTFSYVVVDGQTRECAIIDSVTGFDYVSGRTDTLSADKIISFVQDNNYHVSWLLETHIHADHLSAAPYIKKNTGGMIGIGRHIVEVQRNFYHIFNPEDDFVFDGHDYPPPGRMPVCETTIAQQRASNIHVRDGISEEEFVSIRRAKDKTLEMPVLLIPSIQVNMRAGRLPEVERNGARYIKIPIDTF